MAEEKISITKLFNNIKTGVLGTKTSKIDSEIDAAMKNIITFSSKTAQNKYIETMKNLVRGAGIDVEKEVFKGTSSPIQSGEQAVEAIDPTGRTRRYSEYDAVISKISYLQRALKVLTDNIISPDEITKRAIQFVNDAPDSDSDRIRDISSRLKEIERDINLENKVEKIVNATLKKGDYFTEIIYSPKGQNALTILNENTSYVNSNDSVDNDGSNWENMFSESVEYEFNSIHWVGFSQDWVRMKR